MSSSLGVDPETMSGGDSSLIDILATVFGEHTTLNIGVYERFARAVPKVSRQLGHWLAMPKKNGNKFELFYRGLQVSWPTIPCPDTP